MFKAERFKCDSACIQLRKTKAVDGEISILNPSLTAKKQSRSYSCLHATGNLAIFIYYRCLLHVRMCIRKQVPLL